MQRSEISENQTEERKEIQHVPDYPETLEGWVKKLKKHYDVPQIRAIIALHNSGHLLEACDQALNETEKIPFQVFWEKYSYKVGGKLQTEKVWRQLSYNKQKYIIEEAIPRYLRYISVAGIAQAQAITWLRQKRYNDEIPTKEQIEKFARTVDAYFNQVINFKKHYPSYRPEAEETLMRRAEAFLYRYRNTTPLEVCGVLRWMASTWEHQFRHLVKPTQAMSLQKWPNYFLQAAQHIEAMKKERQLYLSKKALEAELKPIAVQELPFEGNTEEE